MVHSNLSIHSTLSIENIKQQIEVDLDLLIVQVSGKVPLEVLFSNNKKIKKLLKHETSQTHTQNHFCF
jgi:hypothetical protein